MLRSRSVRCLLFGLLLTSVGCSAFRDREPLLNRPVFFNRSQAVPVTTLEHGGVSGNCCSDGGMITGPIMTVQPGGIMPNNLLPVPNQMPTIPPTKIDESNPSRGSFDPKKEVSKPLNKANEDLKTSKGGF